MASTMRAILVNKELPKLTAKALYLGTAPRPALKAGEVLVKVKAFGLNRMDILQRMGKYPLPPGTTDILGVEFSGIVEESQSEKHSAGEEVFGLAKGGAYAEYIACPDVMVRPKPKELSWIQAGGIPENWLTAYQTLFWIGQFKPGERVLVHAGGSGVGLAAIQLAKAFGAAQVFSTAGTDEKVKIIESFGARGINYRKEDFFDIVNKEAGGKGIDVIIDLVGQSYFDRNVKVLATEGRLVEVGLVSGPVPEKPLNLGLLLYKRARIEGTTLRSRSVEYQGDLLKEFTEKALPKLYSGDLKFVLHKTYNWEDITSAHEEMEADKNIGKIVCEIK